AQSRGLEARLAEVGGERHGEAAGVGRRDQLFRRRPHARVLLEATFERVRRVRERSAGGGHPALAVFQPAFPCSRCGALHRAISSGAKRWDLDWGPGAERTRFESTHGARPAPWREASLPGVEGLNAAK